MQSYFAIIAEVSNARDKKQNVSIFYSFVDTSLSFYLG